MEDPSTSSTHPTCPSCGATRSPEAIPYKQGDGALAVYTCASCGARFESWTTSTAGDGDPLAPGHATD